MKLALLSLWVLLPGALSAEPNTPSFQYPPYPDVWGYELAWPRQDDRNTGITVYKMPEREYFVIYFKNPKKAQRKDGTCCDLYEGLSFFAGTHRDLSREEFILFGKTNSKNRVRSNWIGISLQDGSRIEQKNRSHLKCYVAFPYALVKKDLEGRIVTSKTLVYLPKLPKRVDANEFCEGAEGMNHVEEKVEPVFSEFILLDDDTFLAYEPGGNTILRFDKDFNTKYPLNDRMFLVDTAVIDAIRKKVSGGQELIDAVYEHVLRLRRKDAQ